MRADFPVVLITGAARGLGQAMAFAFGKAGYGVALHYYTSHDQVLLTQQQLTKNNIPTQIFKADIRDSSQVNAMIQQLIEHWGRIDVVINNAGATRDKTLQQMSDEEWTQVVDVNLKGPFFVTRAVFPLMREQKEGHIINIGSYVAQRVVRGGGNYASSKAGLVALTKTTAVEGGIYNIRANVVMPGFHVTDMNRSVWERYEKQIREHHLLKDMPQADEMARFVVTIAQQKTVSGQVFPFESRLS